VVLLQDVPAPHTIPPGWPQAGTQALLSQIWEGGPHCASLLHPLDEALQWPLVESQLVPPVHDAAPS
jgi:hypothetical protein